MPTPKESREFDDIREVGTVELKKEVLYFGGALGGIIAGLWLASKTKSSALGTALIVGTPVAGILGARYLGKKYTRAWNA